MTYKLCQECCGPIHRNGVELNKKVGRGYSPIGIFHNYCADKVIKKINKKLWTTKT